MLSHTSSIAFQFILASILAIRAHLTLAKSNSFCEANLTPIYGASRFHFVIIEARGWVPGSLFSRCPEKPAPRRLEDAELLTRCHNTGNRNR